MKKIVLFVLLACIAFSGAAYADSTTASLYVSAHVVPACQVQAYSVDFGSVLAGTSTANGDVQVNCPLDTPYNIALDAGGYYDGTWRRVSDGSGNYIPYGHYKDPAYMTEWGDFGYANTYPYGSSVADTADGLWQSHTVYGVLWIPAGVPANYYSDNVLVTVYF